MKIKNAKCQSEESVHPMCRNSPDPDKCRLFVERLEQATANVNLRRTGVMAVYADEAAKPE